MSPPGATTAAQSTVIGCGSAAPLAGVTRTGAGGIWPGVGVGVGLGRAVAGQTELTTKRQVTAADSKGFREIMAPILMGCDGRRES